MADKPTTPKEKNRQLKLVVSKVVDKAQLTIQAKGYDPEEWKEMMIEALLTNQDIIECEIGSLSKAVLDSCRWGIPPDGQRGAIVWFFNKQTNEKIAQFIPMSEGLKAHVAKWLPDVMFVSGVIRKGDQIERVVEGGKEFFNITQKGDAEEIIGGQSQKEIVGSFCSATIRNPETGAELVFNAVVPLAELEKLKNVSRAGKKNKGPWVEWRERMAEKSAVRLCIKKFIYLADAAQQKAKISVEERSLTLINKDDAPEQIEDNKEVVEAIASPVQEEEETESEVKGEEPPPAEPREVETEAVQEPEPEKKAAPEVEVIEGKEPDGSFFPKEEAPPETGKDDDDDDI